MFDDANVEIEQVTPESRHFPEVLAVGVEIYRTLEKWELSKVVSRKLASLAPDEPHWRVGWAYATRGAESLESARLILLEAAECRPRIAISHFKLACYECQIGELEVAKARLRDAFELNGRLRAVALEDADLVPLWNSRGGEWVG